MPTLTNSATLSIGAAAIAHEETTLVVLPSASGPTGLGSLVHPTLGTLEYEHPPTEWLNIDGDVISPPVWASSKTLVGSVNTLWAGNIRDVVCVERWRDRGALRMTIGQLRTMLAFYVSPPDPDDARVVWRPTYCSALAFEVALVGLTAGGEGIALDWVSQQADGYVSDRDVELTIKILGRAD